MSHSKLVWTGLLAVLLCIAATLRAEEPRDPEISRALGRPISLRLQHDEDIGVVLQSIAAASGILIIPDADVTGKVTVTPTETTLVGALRSICGPKGYYFTIEQGWVSVRRKRMVILAVNYPQLSRSDSSTASMTVSGGSNGGNGILGGTAYTPAGAGMGNGMAGRGGNEGNQFSMHATNEADLWAKLESRLKAMVDKDEAVVVDPFSGLVTIEAADRTISKLRAYLNALNARIGTRVDIMVRILEVTTSNQDKLGIDWSMMRVGIGNVSVGGTVASPSTGKVISGVVGATNMTSVGGFDFNSDTLTGALHAGKVDLVIQALKQQGAVRQVSQPRISTLSNQTAYIKEGIDRPFFSLTSRVTINAGGSTNSGTQPVTENQYSKETYSIGTALAVTPLVDGELVTINTKPVITRLQGVISTPDGSQTAPLLQNKSTDSIVRVRSGETAIIAGLTTTSDADTENAIPGLSAIPVAGRLFKSKGAVNETTELVIFLTPTVIRYGNSDCVIYDPMQQTLLEATPATVTSINF